jgi:hypothetical protein
MDVREKGHRFERQIVKQLKDIGYEDAVTTRANSKLLDACGVDIDNVPFYIQCKSGYKRGLNYSKIFEYMKTKLLAKFKKINKPLIIMHKKSSKKFENLVAYEDNDYIVIMAYDDFIEKLKKDNEYIQRPSSSQSVTSETISNST